VLEGLQELVRGDEVALVVLELLVVALQQHHQLVVVPVRFFVGEVEQQTVAEWGTGYLSTFADEFSLQKIFSIRSIMFSKSNHEVL
jgi:hypothetical protein